MRYWHRYSQLVLGLLSLAPLFLTSACSNYSCGSPSGGIHCYGIAQQQPGGVVAGLSTSMTIVPLNGGDGHVSDEAWLQDGNSHWVEVGLAASNGNICGVSGSNPTGDHVFWADQRPNSVLYCHDMGLVQPQEIGGTVALIISSHTAPGANANFEAIAEVCPPGAGPCRTLVGLSRNNSMQPTVIQFGVELAGSSGANIPQTTFSDNMFILGPGPWTYPTTNGLVNIQSPPITATWAPPPVTSGSGGTWIASCCN